MKKIALFLFFLFFSITYSFSQVGMAQLIENNMQLAVKQYLLLEKNTPDSLMPRNYDPAKGKLNTSNTKWWCSGFFPGSCWYIYEYTKDVHIKMAAEKRMKILEKEKYLTDHHDLGFMIYNSFGNAYRLTGNMDYKEVVVTAAGSLATRYRPSIKSIQSWNKSDKFECPVIIDNMMNLELLYWASMNGGSYRYYDIAINHANSTLKHHFRPDNSSYHVLDYDLATGNIIKKVTAQGAADSSAWARGQAWGLYGFTVMYRFTHNKKYLEQAERIADFMLQHPNMPADKIPYWDFNAPNIPTALRDASAAAIMASALLELAQYVKKKERSRFVEPAETILRSLSAPQYLSAPGENGGFLLKHSVGAIPYNSEVDVSLTYADYYFLEAMMRYKNWYLDK